MSEEGIKYDTGKLDWSQLDIESLEDMIEVLMMGEKKYSFRNWVKVEPWDRRYFCAALRHLTSWWKGEKIDSESGKSHLAHAACCLMFLQWNDKRKERTYIPND